MRTYDDGCAAAHALDLVGERWALLVVRELLLGPKRFTDLRAGLPHASPNVLSERLRGLEEVGIVRRRRLPPPAASKIYELTAWGEELEPVIIRLGRWGARSPSKPADAPLGVDSLILSLRTMFDPVAAGDLEATYELIMGEDRFSAEVSRGDFEVAPAHLGRKAVLSHYQLVGRLEISGGYRVEHRPQGEDQGVDPEGCVRRFGRRAGAPPA